LFLSFRDYDPVHSGSGGQKGTGYRINDANITEYAQNDRNICNGDKKSFNGDFIKHNTLFKKMAKFDVNHLVLVHCELMDFCIIITCTEYATYTGRDETR
jgi:hypothetical protein